MAVKKQSALFKGILEFEDPAGVLLASKTPAFGTADLYDGTAIVVKPNQCAMLIYKGEITDVLMSGTHYAKTENLPIITKLANWRFGFESPLRCEVWFFSGNVFTALKWGTTHPVMHQFEDVGLVGLRAFGNYNIAIRDPKKFYMSLIGSKVNYDLADVEDFVQGQILELLPEALDGIKSFKMLNKKQKQVAEKLHFLVRKEFKNYGLLVEKIQVLSIVPPTEVIQAMDAKTAMGLIGDHKTYLLYKAANSLEAGNNGNNGNADPMQMMMGLMLGKGLLSGEATETKKVPATAGSASSSSKQKAKAEANFCHECGSGVNDGHKFCSNCGAKL